MGEGTGCRALSFYWKVWNWIKVNMVWLTNRKPTTFMIFGEFSCVFPDPVV